MITSIESFNVTEYRFPQSRWTIGSLSYLRTSFYGETSLHVQNYSVYLCPSLNYYLSTGWSLGLFSALTVSHYSNNNESEWLVENPFLGPGANIKVNKQWTITPILTIPTYAIELSNVALQAFLVGKVF